MTQAAKLVDFFAQGVLLLGALAFGVFGARWLLNPAAMATPLGIVLTNGDATSDARAVYGGMELGLSAFLVYSALSPSRRSQGLAAATFTLVGLGVSRLIGIRLASGVGAGTLQLLGTDFAGSVLCGAALLVGQARKRP